MFNFGHWQSKLQHCVVLVACGVCIPGIVRAEENKQQAMKGMQVTVNEAQRRVDITFDGLPFTSYIWPTSLKKPVLYPLTAPGGVIVSRGWPLEPRPKERVDHPHQVGMWFNYGNINGFDFWNNSDAIKPEVREKYGTIHQERIVSTRSGPTSGELVVQTVWTTGKGQDIIKETTRFIFLHRSNANVIDRITTLTALDHLVFHDDKEGLFGMRVAHFLESADEKAGLYMDSSGNATKVANGDTTGATGVYLTSEDKQGDAAWGTRGGWCILRGKTADQPITAAIFDHPSNPGYPTYWMVRGYGLAGANPLADSIFDPKAPVHNFALEKGASATFRYRVIFYSFAATPKEANKESDAFSAEYK